MIESVGPAGALQDFAYHAAETADEFIDPQRTFPPQAYASCQASRLQRKLKDQKSVSVERLQKPPEPRGHEHWPNTEVAARTQRREAKVGLVRVQEEDGLVQSYM